MGLYLCEDTLNNIMYLNQELYKEHYLRYIFLVMILIYIMYHTATENACYLLQMEVQEIRNYLSKYMVLSTPPQVPPIQSVNTKVLLGPFSRH